jgi:NADH:ubiquinone oxidoreductase subunit C
MAAIRASPSRLRNADRLFKSHPTLVLSVTIASPRSHPLGKNYPSDGKQVINLSSQNEKMRQELPGIVKESTT